MGDLLGVARVGTGDNFFHLGGNSLLAARLTSAVRARLGRDLPVRSIFEQPAIGRIAASLPDLAWSSGPTLKPRQRTERIPLSFAQRRLWFLSRLEVATATYNIPAAARLVGKLDRQALYRAFLDVIARHESLRTLLVDDDGVPRQLVMPPMSAETDFIFLCETCRDGNSIERLHALAAYGFDLARELPIRVHLLETSDEEHALLLLLHHAAGDGWSFVPLLRDLSQAYASRCEGHDPDWNPLPVQYVDYALWQRDLLGENANPRSRLARGIAWWRKQLAGLPVELNLPGARQRPPVSTHPAGRIERAVPASLHERMADLARLQGVSMFMLTHAAVAALLHRMGAGDDIPVGAVTAGRSDRKLDDLVGFFVNTLVIRHDLSGTPTTVDLLARIRRTSLDAFTNAEVPFERLVEAIGPPRGLGRHPLFQVMAVYQSVPTDILSLPGVHASRLPIYLDTARFDLGFVFSEEQVAGASRLKVELEYSSDLFDPETAASIVDRLVRVLAAMVATPELPLSRLDVLPAAERDAVLVGFNAVAGMPLPVSDTSIVSLFAAQVARAPDATALIHGEAELSYAALEAGANRLAHHLRGLGVGPERVVGICLDRSFGLVEAMLAVLKVGGAYLPLDPAYPPERLAMMLADAAPVAVLTTCAGRVAAGGRSWHCAR